MALAFFDANALTCLKLNHCKELASSFVSFVSFAHQNVDPYARIFSLCLTIFLTLKVKKISYGHM